MIIKVLTVNYIFLNLSFLILNSSFLRFQKSSEKVFLIFFLSFATISQAKAVHNTLNSDPSLSAEQTKQVLKLIMSMAQKHFIKINHKTIINFISALLFSRSWFLFFVFCFLFFSHRNREFIVCDHA